MWQILGFSPYTSDTAESKDTHPPKHLLLRIHFPGKGDRGRGSKVKALWDFGNLPRIKLQSHSKETRKLLKITFAKTIRNQS